MLFSSTLIIKMFFFFRGRRGERQGTCSLRDVNVYISTSNTILFIQWCYQRVRQTEKLRYSLDESLNIMIS